MEWIVPTLGMKRSQVGDKTFPSWENISRFCWQLCLVLYRYFWSFRAEISHLSTFWCKWLIFSCLEYWEISKISPLSLLHLSCDLYFRVKHLVFIGEMEGGMKERWGRDKKNLSEPESPVFMLVLRDLLRDEGFYPKVMLSTSTGSWRKIWACSLNLLGFSVVR